MGTPTAIVDDPPSGSIGSRLNLPDSLERLMFGRHVDSTPQDFLLHAGTSYQERVQHHLDQYAAMLHVIGVIAGVAGEEGERDELIAAIQQAMQEYGQTLAEQNQREHFYSNFNSPVDVLSTGAGVIESLWGGNQYLAGSGLKWIGEQTGSDMITSAGQTVQAYGAEDIREGVDTIYTNYDGMAIQAAGDLWDSIVEGAKEWWNWFTTQVKEEGLIIALGQAHVDASFLAAEMAIDIGIGLVTAGWGGAAFRAIRIVGRRVVDGATDVMVKLARHGAPDVPVKKVTVPDGTVSDIARERVPDVEMEQGHPDVEDLTTPNAETPTTSKVDGAAADAPPPPTYSNRPLTQAERDRARRASPTDDLRDQVNSGQPIATKDNPVPDPWLDGLERTARLEADHIVPLSHILDKPGFSDLTVENQNIVLNLPENFHGLSRSANASRGNKSFEEWTEHVSSGTPVTPELRQRMIAEEARLNQVIQQKIDELLRKQQATNGSGPPFRD